MKLSQTAPSYDALIFDLDGTLWDATETVTRGWNEGLASLGLSERVNAQGIRDVSGRPHEECFAILLPGPAKAMGLKSLVEKVDVFEKAVIERDGGELYPDTQDVVRELSSRHRLYLVSNCQQWYLQAFLQHSGLGDCFRDVLCHGSRREPKSENLRYLAEHHGLARPVYIGDTMGDEEAARLAGMAFLACRYGFAHLDRPGAITCLRELLERF